MSTLPSANSQTPAALGHLRVLDLTGYLSQLCARVLGDLGADVIKVEPPGGDPARLLAPFAGDQRDPERSLRFINSNRSKRSVVLDIDSSDDRAKIAALAGQVDILIEDFDPGHMAGLGLGYEELRQRNPGLVYVSITPFGQTGPYAGFHGGDLIAQSSAGVMIANGDDEMRPCRGPYDVYSQVCCFQAAYGALLAIHARRESGHGQHVDVSRQETTISAEHPYIYRYTYERIIARREGRHSPFGAVNSYVCSDGKVVNLSVYSDIHFGRLSREVMDNHPILSEEVWQPQATRRDNREFIDDLVGEYALTVESADLVERGQRLGIAITPVQNIDEFVHHPHTAARGFIEETEHPVIGKYRTAGAPARLGVTPWQSRRPAPLLGQHTDEVLSELAELVKGAAPATPTPNSQVQQDPADPFKNAPLKGIRIADLTRAVAGPAATRYLSTFGAEVIKVEESGLPDTGLPQELNRAKLSTIIDSRRTGGTELVKDLVRISDVVVENFRPGVMDRLGLSYEELRKVKPDIIVIAMPGMGSTGPIKDYLAYGQQVMGLTGLTDLWGHPESLPATRIKMPFPDFITGTIAPVAIMAALEWRDRTGEGQYIEVAQVEGTAHLLSVAYMDYMLNGRIARGQGNSSDYYAPHDVYPCMGFDAWCAIEVGNEEEWKALVGAMGDRGSWALDERFQTMEGRLAYKEELDVHLGGWTKGFTPRLLMLKLQKAGVPACIVASGEDLYQDVHLRSRPGSIAQINHPNHGLVEYKGVNVHLSATPGWGAVANPARGEHNDYVFRELLGRDKAQIQELTDAGTIV
jgi:crotonobetainyl-CoA:carnitine CoA-transferase CaiB-like acyl-CoA transferase